MPFNKDQSKKDARPEGRFQKQNSPQWSEVQNALSDVKETFGFVPSFSRNFVDSSLPGAWSEAKNLRFSPGALDTKTKGLMAIAIATQIPCEMINYFEMKATVAEGASRQEQIEAVLMAAITRHWSTVLNGSQLDKDEFRKEADSIMAYVKRMMDESGGKMPPEEMFLVKPGSADEAYRDMEKTLGLVPKFFRMFPKEGIAGAWSEFKGLQLNPHTALNGVQKELIGLAVAAQIPCDYCVYFHRAAATLNGAGERELQEAVGLAAVTRHWSTIFHGPDMDFAGFRKDADEMLKNLGKRNLQ